MKLLLTSNGFSTPEIIAKCEELVGKPRFEINTIVINEAYAVEHADHHWLIDDLVRLSTNFGGNIEFLNLLANDIETMKARIETCDMIFVIGGHTDYLKSVFNKTGFSEILTEVLQSKVLDFHLKRTNPCLNSCVNRLNNHGLCISILINKTELV